jgi:Sec-independent protein secretion pathway component TatC
VVIAALGGLFTPSNDLISMALMSFPLLGLYFGSILLVKQVERSKARDKMKPA